MKVLVLADKLPFFLWGPLYMGIIVRGRSLATTEIILESVDLFLGHFGCLVLDVKYNCGTSSILRKTSKEITGSIDRTTRLYMRLSEDHQLRNKQLINSDLPSAHRFIN